MKRTLSLMALIIFALSCTERSLDDSKMLMQSNVPLFKSDSFHGLADQLALMSDDEFVKWEEQNSFESYRTVLKRAHSEWALVEDESQQSSFVAKYADILSVVDGRIVPNISIPYYQRIINRQGFFQVGDFLHKVDAEYVVSANAQSHNKLFEKDLVAKYGEKGGASSGIKVMRYLPENISATGKKAQACWYEMIASYFKNQSGCKNDREVFINTRSYMNTWTDYEGDHFGQRFMVGVWGEIRNGFCNWNMYHTEVHRQSVSFNMTAWDVINGIGIPTAYTITIPDRSDEFSSEMVWDGSIGDVLLNQYATAANYNSFYGRGATRGTDNNWAVLSCP